MSPAWSPSPPPDRRPGPGPVTGDTHHGPALLPLHPVHQHQPAGLTVHLAVPPGVVEEPPLSINIHHRAVSRGDEGAVVTLTTIISSTVLSSSRPLPPPFSFARNKKERHGVCWLTFSRNSPPAGLIKNIDILLVMLASLLVVSGD